MPNWGTRPSNTGASNNNADRAAEIRRNIESQTAELQRLESDMRNSQSAATAVFVPAVGQKYFTIKQRTVKDWVVKSSTRNPSDRATGQAAFGNAEAAHKVSAAFNSFLKVAAENGSSVSDIVRAIESASDEI